MGRVNMALAMADRDLHAIVVRTFLALIMLSACSQEPAGQESGISKIVPREEPDAGDPPSEYVFIPDDDFTTSVEIVVPTDALAGEWIPVGAKRRSGPWKRVTRKEVPPGKPSLTSQPREFEPEVARNVTWLTEPPFAAIFDIPSIEEIRREGVWTKRKAMFAKPGIYKIWAENGFPSRAKSNVVTITVRSGLAAAASADCGDDVAAAFERLRTSGRPYRKEVTFIVSDQEIVRQTAEFLPPDRKREITNYGVPGYGTSEIIRVGQRAWLNNSSGWPWGWREWDPRLVQMILENGKDFSALPERPVRADAVFECLGRVEFKGTAYIGYRARLNKAIVALVGANGALSETRNRS
jgi:hypothetical protein